MYISEMEWCCMVNIHVRFYEREWIVEPAVVNKTTLHAKSLRCDCFLRESLLLSTDAALGNKYL
jgi:hypothetical protein